MNWKPLTEQPDHNHQPVLIARRSMSGAAWYLVPDIHVWSGESFLNETTGLPLAGNLGEYRWIAEHDVLQGLPA